MTSRNFPPSRKAGLSRLDAFLPHAGGDYAQGRNTDKGPDTSADVSLMSPYLRYRLVSEKEVVAKVRSVHTERACEKYVQEVLWRTYWKGWLELRPTVWTQFEKDRDKARAEFSGHENLKKAEAGETGIEGFDDWARELRETGYLHNHARMWFASIWIFTLELPWALGADFFLRHLIDADPASNTLSWRWVAGIQTAGKTYLATTENIEKFTNGRFAPKGLATSAPPLNAPPRPEPLPLRDLPRFEPKKPSILLVTQADLSPETLLPKHSELAGIHLVHPESWLWGDKARDFIDGAMTDAQTRLEDYFECKADRVQSFKVSALVSLAHKANVTQIVTPYAPVGPVASALDDAERALKDEGVSLILLRRPWDTHFWPHAKKGFFPFKKQIRSGLSALGVHPD